MGAITQRTAGLGSLLIFAFASFLLVAGSALAQNTVQRDPEAEFQLADFDGNGCVNWEELRNRAMIVFGGLDEDNDGIISAHELQHLVTDGRVLPEEAKVEMHAIQAALRTAFEAEDADGSGCIERSEWT